MAVKDDIKTVVGCSAVAVLHLVSLYYYYPLNTVEVVGRCCCSLESVVPVSAAGDSYSDIALWPFGYRNLVNIQVYKV